MPKPSPDVCKHCDSDELPENHWKWNKSSRRGDAGGFWVCRIRQSENNKKYAAKRSADPDRAAAYTLKMREYYLKDPVQARYKAYVRKDRLKGFADDPICWERAEPIMLSPCRYCGLNPAGGLDRVLNCRGHSDGNVVPCCSSCNYILIDMPMRLKNELASALRSAREKGLFDIWTHPRLR